MPKINENKLARDIAEREGGAKKLSIGQIKEVLKHGLDILAEEYQGSEVLALVEKHRPV